MSEVDEASRLPVGSASASMGSFRPVDCLELVERDGRTTLVTFRPRRHSELDSDRYPGIHNLPPLGAWERRPMPRRRVPHRGQLWLEL